MSLLAGFDFVSEISNETILKLIRTNFELGGISADPPFEITIPITGGSAHLVLTGLNLDLNADDTATLTYDFDRGSVEIASPVKLAVCPLAGSIAIQASISLQDGDNQTSRWPSPSRERPSPTRRRRPGHRQQPGGQAHHSRGFQDVRESGRHHVRSIGGAARFRRFLQGSARRERRPRSQAGLERLEVHCIANPSRSKQALALFGILLKANNAHGDHTRKRQPLSPQPMTASALTRIDPVALVRVTHAGNRIGVG